MVLQRLSDAGVVKGEAVGIGATTLEANAALRSIVRRDTGEGYETIQRGTGRRVGRCDADAGETTTMVETLTTAAEQIEAGRPAGGLAEVVGEKGDHSNETTVALAELGLCSYVSEPARGRRRWQGKPAARAAVYGNRRPIPVARGQRLLQQPGERLERRNAHR